jgi:hypothetical protein
MPRPQAIRWIRREAPDPNGGRTQSHVAIPALIGGALAQAPASRVHMRLVPLVACLGVVVDRQEPHICQQALRALGLSSCNELQDITGIGTMVGALTELDISECYRICDFSVAKMIPPALRGLNLCDTTSAGHPYRALSAS